MPKTTPPERRRVPDFDDKQIKLVRTRLNEGRTGEQVARELGPQFTAAIVLGRAKRLGIASRGHRRAHLGNTGLYIEPRNRTGDAADPAHGSAGSA